MINVVEEFYKAITAAGKRKSTDIIAYNLKLVDWSDTPTRQVSGTTFTKTSLDAINVDYNNGYGYQQLFGYVLFDDGTWLSRGEYDGSEWWEYNKPPTVDEILNYKN